MEYFFIILPKMVSFILLICTGVTMVRLKLFTEDNISLLTNMILKLILPCFCLYLTLANNINFRSLWDYRMVFAGQGMTYIILLLAALFINRVCKLESPTSNCTYGVMAGGNFGFVVTPLVAAMFAEEGGRYIAICAMIDTIFVWGLAMYFFTNIKGRERAKGSFLKRFFNPIVSVLLIGMVLNQIGIQVPTVVLDTIQSVGTMSPLGLVYLGALLGFTSLKRIKSAVPFILIVALRLIAIPVLVYLILRNRVTEIEAMIIVLITAAPSFSGSTGVAKSNDLDVDYTAMVVFITTICSMVTIPLVFYLMARISGN